MIKEECLKLKCEEVEDEMLLTKNNKCKNRSLALLLKNCDRKIMVPDRKQLLNRWNGCSKNIKRGGLLLSNASYKKMKTFLKLSNTFFIDSFNKKVIFFWSLMYCTKKQ